MKKLLVLLVVVGFAAGLIWLIYDGYTASPENEAARNEERVSPVEVADIAQGTLIFRRTFSGTLEAAAAFVVAPKISGRVVHLAVDLADSVARGQTVVKLDDREYVQEVTQAQADLAVAEANLTEARSGLEISDRELKRLEELRQRGLASESEVDESATIQLGAQARLEVARAQLQRAQASLESAKIRLAYTTVNAEWTGGSDRRVVAERLVDEGDTVSANAPLLSIVELSPITAAIFITERDYAQIRVGQTAQLATDAFPGEEFSGRVERVSPVFRQESRQARVELVIENGDERLKPGMFVRVTLELGRAEDVSIVPDAAIAIRGDREGLFVVSEDGKRVAWRPVTTGLRDNNRVEVSGEGLTGRVVTLGQQLLDDGSAITIPGQDSGEPGE